jgi:signal peptidase II
VSRDGGVSSTIRETGAMKPSRNAVMAYLIAGLVLVVDQVSKFWVLEKLHLEERGPVPVLPFFQLHMVWNQGVSFGLLRSGADMMRWVLVAFSVGVVCLLIWWAARQTRRLPAVALGLIIGGAIGNNFIDRVRFGAVVDFLDFGGLSFPWVFNVADSAISVGVVLLLLDSLFHRETKSEH